MKKWWVVAICGLWLLGTAGAGWSDNGRSVSVNVLSTGFPELVLYVNVLDENGDPVTGLSEADFAVTEQSETEGAGVGESLTCFEEFTGDGAGISVALVFDLSSSMKDEKLEETQAAAIEFLQNTGDQDRASLVTFSSCGMGGIQMPADWVSTDADDSGRADIVEAVEGLRSLMGMTALYDGTAWGIQSISQEAAPKAVIVFTDGKVKQNCEYETAEAVIEKANQEAVPVYTIGLGEDADHETLEQMAIQTGGYYRYSPTPQDMAAIYQDMAESIRSRYKLCYTSHTPQFDGTTRTVTVAVNGDSGTGTYVVNASPSIVRDDRTRALSENAQIAGTSLSLSGHIQDADAQSLGQTLTGTLFYRQSGTDEYSQLPLSLGAPADGNYPFTVDIPAEGVDYPGVDYYIRASDGIREGYEPFNYSQLPHVIPVLENQAPAIAHTPVSQGMVGVAIAIEAEVTDPNGNETVDQVTLHYRRHEPDQQPPYLPVPMTPADGLSYTAQIPGEAVTADGVDYFISAWDEQGVRADSGTSQSPYYIQVSTQPNQAPVAVAGDDQRVDEGSWVSLDGSGSHDPDGSTLDFLWEPVDGPAITLSGPTDPQTGFYAPEVDGDTGVTLRLTVTDGAGARDSATVQVMVADTDTALPSPQADFVWSPEIPENGETVRFTDQSTAPGQTIVSRQWDFAGLGSSQGISPTFTFSQPGQYDVSLTVTAANGESDTLQATVQIKDRCIDCEDDEGGDSGCFVNTLH